VPRNSESFTISSSLRCLKLRRPAINGVYGNVPRHESSYLMQSPDASFGFDWSSPQSRVFSSSSANFLQTSADTAFDDPFDDSINFFNECMDELENSEKPQFNQFYDIAEVRELDDSGTQLNEIARSLPTKIGVTDQATKQRKQTQRRKRSILIIVAN
jgi:hypothetical protein